MVAHLVGRMVKRLVGSSEQLQAAGWDQIRVAVMVGLMEK